MVQVSSLVGDDVKISVRRRFADGGRSRVAFLRYRNLLVLELAVKVAQKRPAWLWAGGRSLL